MTLIAHHPHGRGHHDGDESRLVTVLKAFVTIVLVTAVIGAVLGGATYVVSRAVVGMLP